MEASSRSTVSFGFRTACGPSRPQSVITTNYFDDFVSIAESREVASVHCTVKAVFRLLGWRFAEDGPKAPPFCSSLVALGVELDVSHLHNGTVHVANTESRRTNLAQSLDHAIGSRVFDET